MIVISTVEKAKALGKIINDFFHDSDLKQAVKKIKDQDILVLNPDFADFKNLVTNSGKYTYYSPTTLGTKCYYTSGRACIETAIKGAIVEEKVI